MTKKTPETTPTPVATAPVTDALRERPLTPAELCRVVGGGSETIDRMRGLLLISEAQTAGLIELRDGKYYACQKTNG